jgi:MoxR-like ATPase
VDNYEPQCWKDFDAVINGGVDRLILFGPPGTGKTLAGLKYGNVDAGAFRLECTENMTEFDIVGGFMPSGEHEWKYKEGSMVKGWVGDGLNGGRVVVDEIDKASGDILALLLAMTDSKESAVWEHPATGRKIRPNDGFSVVMTTNLLDMAHLDRALKDRFPVAIHIDQPHPDAVARLPRKFQNLAVSTIDDYSLRTWFEVAKLEKAVGLDEALRLVIGGDKAKQLADDLKIEAVE